MRSAFLEGHRELDRHMYVGSLYQFETNNLEHFACARCGASDRDRLSALYLRGRLVGGDVLHVAPSRPLNRWLTARPGVTVRTADLMMPGVDDVVDLCAMMEYDDGRFDAFVCSHVLEHVDDDHKAMSELRRVLKPGGFGIAMVPVDVSLTEVVEDPTIKDPGDRVRVFGQWDRVRLYSKAGFVDRLESAGFRVLQLGAGHFGVDVFERNAIHPRSVLYVVERT
jgi:SAM-dependent methyltransferase